MTRHPCRRSGADAGRVIPGVYRLLYKRYGPQRWWPGDTRFEIIVGAILTQNTAWTNVEKAILNLKRAGALASPAAMRRLPASRLARLIRPAGYYNVKAKRLANFLGALRGDHGLSLRSLARRSTEDLRGWLLAVNGIGPETADSILLYAFGRPVFVVDAYTKRIFSRIGYCAPDAAYHDVQRLFAGLLPEDALLFNEYHALIVRLGKEACRTSPKCALCPVGEGKIACK